MLFSKAWELFSRERRQRFFPEEGISLALGGGAVLGAAHIGVLKALEEEQIKVRQISGTSIGALIATLYAFGKSPLQIEQIVTELDWLGVSSLTMSKFGILSNDELGEKVKGALGDVSFKDSEIPLSLVATDLATGHRVVLQEGGVATAVMASSCIPGVFVPVEVNGGLLVDGGLVENVPISPLLGNEEEFVVGVDLSARRSYQRPDDIIDVLANSIDIVIDNVTRSQTNGATLIIAPELMAFNRRDTSRIGELIEEGYRSAQKQLAQHKRKDVA